MKTLVSDAIRAWQVAAQALAIEVVAPYSLDIRQVPFGHVVFLPDFGGPKGMLIGWAVPPDFDVEDRLVEFAKRTGLFYSFINPEMYAVFDVDRFKEALTDWGYFGPEKRRPKFLD